MAREEQKSETHEMKKDPHQSTVSGETSDARDIGTILKDSRELGIRIRSVFSLATLEARRQGNSASKILSENDFYGSSLWIYTIKTA